MRYQDIRLGRPGTKTKQQIRNKTDGKFSCLSFFDQKVLSAKIYLKEMIHTDFIVGSRDKRNRLSIDPEDFFEDLVSAPYVRG